MGLQDLVVTPLYLLVIYFLAFFVKGKVADKATEKYFIPSLTIKFIGAIGLGLIYQFYYGGGDTFNYWRNGEHIYHAFFNDPINVLNLIFGDPNSNLLFDYQSKIWLMRSDSAFFIVKLSAIFDLFTFHTYSATSLFFGLFCFSGSWAFFQLLSKKFQGSEKYIFFSIFLMPSLVIWSSGILKDSITIGALFWMVWSVVRWVEFKKRDIIGVFVCIVSFYLIYRIKFYVLMCLIPGIIIYMVAYSFSRIKSLVIRVAVAPVLIMILGVFIFLSLERLGNENESYSIENIAEKSKTTAYDLRYGWGKGAGSGYSIGQHDGSWFGMLKIGPQGIIAALFRPFIWESGNILMLIAALESSLILILFINMLRKRRKKSLVNDPFLLFCFVFSIVFAFAVGISTFNFGTLSRYRIPLLPFFMIYIGLITKKNVRNTQNGS